MITKLSITRKLVMATAVLSLAGCLSQEKGETTNPDPATPASNNSAPTIWGAPANAVMTGDSYSFTPSSNDPDGDTLTYSIRNQPVWASFNLSTGRLSGQPVLGHEGVYDGIVITVSDGSASTSLDAFSIEVTQAALGAMTLSWAAPIENTDGSALTDLAGFNIYYGESSGSYPKRIRIDNPSISTYVVENLLPRTYYIVATAFNAAGVESTFSNEATKTVIAD